MIIIRVQYWQNLEDKNNTSILNYHDFVSSIPKESIQNIVILEKTETTTIIKEIDLKK